MRIKIGLIVIVFLVGLTVLMAQNQKDDAVRSAQTTEVSSIKSFQDLTATYLGRQALTISEWKELERSIPDTTFYDYTIIPFQHDPNGQMLKVEIDNGVIKQFVNQSGDTVTYKRPITMFFDRDSKKLLKIESNLNLQSQSNVSTESQSKLEKTLLTKDMNFKGLPDSISSSFISVIQKCPFSPHLAEKISAVYVMDSSVVDNTIRPMWVISLIGIPPLKQAGPFADRIPESMRNFIRIVADGTTGKVLTASN